MIMRNCQNCGKVYNSSHRTLCPECVEQDETDFEKVRNFIKDNPKVSIAVVSEATEVEEDKIEQYLRDGKLETADLSGPMLQCDKCGKPIHAGKYCVVCQGELRNTFQSGRSSQLASGSEDKKQGGSFTRRYRGES